MGTQLIFLGAPGSGKGTQAKLMAKEKGYKHVSTGDLLRSEVAKNSDLGSQIKKILEKGALVADDLVLALLQKNCDLDLHHYIFDGFPRNLDQAKALEKSVLQGHKALAVYFQIDLDNLKQRLINRRTCEDCGAIFNLVLSPPKVSGVCDRCQGKNLIQRQDDRESVVNERMRIFSSTIGPILEFYSEKGALRRVDASHSADQVFRDVLKTLSE
jgi:adenylate kinase